VTRVLHLVAVPWQSTDGVARACQELVRELDDHEHVLVSDRDPGSAGADFAAVRVVRGWPPFLPWRRAFRGAYEDFAPDVVHLHGGELVPLLAYAPVFSDCAVVASSYAVTPVERVFSPVGPVVRANGGAQVSPIAARWSDEPTVVCAGRAQSGRGIDDLIDAFPLVRAAIPRARLRLLLLPGDSADRWRSRLAGTEWADVCIGTADSLRQEFARAQVASFPFRWSVTMTPALAAAEAMAVGLPLVATRVGCLAPLVEHGVNGALVEPRDPVALARALADVLAGPDSWQPLSEGARKTIEERWSWSDAAAATADAYRVAQRGRL
jgi:glycosyltransferase involved in cell wall biosynthesis